MHLSRRYLFLGILFAASFVLSACVPRQEGDVQRGVPAPGQDRSEEKRVPSEFQAIEMVSGNFFFTPKNLSLKKGEAVTIRFQNSGVHTFTIDELGVNIPLRGSSPVAEFTPEKSGTFEYYCAVPGHREGGMFGSLTVEE